METSHGGGSATVETIAALYRLKPKPICIGGNQSRSLRHGLQPQSLLSSPAKCSSLTNIALHLAEGKARILFGSRSATDRSLTNRLHVKIGFGLDLDLPPDESRSTLVWISTGFDYPSLIW
ncbi:hypothetical protein L2E82_31015 [Cichorium intybus]|uniref:Uncharacterized protein n=1 Tax=Cichorium intybus TaxID=13427 RepID=A0ACB9D2M8_CICIN|nr:hypothetical protein L2E82_31015 [Cichorium intybus]